MDRHPQADAPLGRYPQADIHLGRHPLCTLRREMVNRQAVHILLECFLVSNRHFTINYNCQVLVGYQLIPVYCTTYLDQYLCFYATFITWSIQWWIYIVKFCTCPQALNSFNLMQFLGNFWQNHISVTAPHLRVDASILMKSWILH